MIIKLAARLAMIIKLASLPYIIFRVLFFFLFLFSKFSGLSVEQILLVSVDDELLMIQIRCLYFILLTVAVTEGCSYIKSTTVINKMLRINIANLLFNY